MVKLNGGEPGQLMVSLVRTRVMSMTSRPADGDKIPDRTTSTRHTESIVCGLLVPVVIIHIIMVWSVCATCTDGCISTGFRRGAMLVCTLLECTLLVHC